MRRKTGVKKCFFVLHNNHLTINIKFILCFLSLFSCISTIPYTISLSSTTGSDKRWKNWNFSIDIAVTVKLTYIVVKRRKMQISFFFILFALFLRWAYMSLLLCNPKLSFSTPSLFLSRFFFSFHEIALFMYIYMKKCIYLNKKFTPKTLLLMVPCYVCVSS